MKVLRWWAGAAAGTATMLVAACGGSSGAISAPPSSTSASVSSSAPASVGPPPAAAALTRQVKSAAATAKSVHITATVTQGGTNAGLNLSLTRSDDMYGQITDKNRPVVVLVTQGHTYLKATAATLKGLGIPSVACQLICNKYLKMSARQSKSLVGQVGWSTMVEPMSSVPQLHYVRTVSVNGQPAWQMSAGSLGTAYVAAQGTPYLLRAVMGSNRIDFTQWNSVTIPPPPPASQVLDLSQLKHF